MRTLFKPMIRQPEEPCSLIASVTLPDEAINLQELIDAYASGQRQVDVQQTYFDFQSADIDLESLSYRPQDDDLAYQYMHLEEVHRAAQAAQAAQAAARTLQADGQPPADNAATATEEAKRRQQGSQADNGGLSAAPEGPPSE